MGGLEKAKNSGLHDYEIVEIEVDYNNANIIMVYNSPDGKRYEFNIEKFITFTISHEEAWGKGKYVCSSEIQLVNDNMYMLEIELNSGDRIIAKYLI